ncbi:MAG: hypothetical protein LBT79_06665 [Elusimicrobiota bacterium]|jgi:hypothetical protein|nr:hypothetical protein [Elusimicrobiota bacterium]
MNKSNNIKRIIEEIKVNYIDVNIVYIQESLDDYGIEIAIDNKKVFNSFSYAEFIFNNTRKDEESGKYINFIFFENQNEFNEHAVKVFERCSFDGILKEFIKQNEEVIKFNNNILRQEIDVLWSDLAQKIKEMDLSSHTIKKEFLFNLENTISLGDKFTSSGTYKILSKPNIVGIILAA